MGKPKYSYCTLDQLGSVSRGKSKHRPRNDPALYGGSYPFIQTGDVKHSQFYITEYTQTYNELGLAQSKLWPANTLCITIAANIADSAILTFPACFPDSIIGFIPDQNKSDLSFVKYCLDTYKKQMQAISKGTTQDNLSQDKLLTIKLLVPPLSTQTKIASILSAYDDLIENNKRRIAILEKMAEEIYREWFVRMRFSSYAKASEDKPANQSKSVKGCPLGWTVSKLSDVLELCYGKALKEEDRTDGPYPVYGSSGVVGYHNRALVKEAGIIVGRKGNVGSIHWSDEPFFPIDTAYFVRSELPKEYLYFLLHGMNFINNDAAVPGLSRSQAYANQFFLPPSESISRFADLVRPFFQLKKTISEQVLLLVRTRDLLLPRLISGKLSVEDLELPSNEKLTAVSSKLPQQELAHA